MKLRSEPNTQISYTIFLKFVSCRDSIALGNQCMPSPIFLTTCRTRNYAEYQHRKLINEITCSISTKICLSQCYTDSHRPIYIHTPCLCGGPQAISLAHLIFATPARTLKKKLHVT